MLTHQDFEARPGSRLRLLIADDHALVMAGLVKLLEPEYDLVATLTNGRDALEAVGRLRPDIVLLDIAMPSLNGIEAARQIHARHPEMKIIVVTMHANKDYVREAFRAGASGYVLKHAAVAELTNALREVKEGRYFISPQLTKDIPRAALDPTRNPGELFGRLTPRQREVLQLVTEGKSAKEIAYVLNISRKTVEFHKAAIMEELGVRSTAELVRYAVEHSLVES